MGEIAAFARKVDRLGKGLSDLERRRLVAVVRKAKREIEDEVRSASGGDLRLSGVGRKGAKLGVRDRTETGSGTIYATGPIQLIEHDTAAHVIPRVNRRKKKVLHFPDGSFRRTVEHPGTSGKAPFAKGVRKVRPKIGRYFDQETAEIIGGVF